MSAHVNKAVNQDGSPRPPIPAHAFVADRAYIHVKCRIHGGEFHGGAFYGGEFHGGFFIVGTFHGGEFFGGSFRGGTFQGGAFQGGAFYGGAFQGGEFYEGKFYGGNFYTGDVVRATRDKLVIDNIGSEDQTLTLVRTATGHRLGIGCWRNGTVEELKAEVLKRCPERWDSEYKAIKRLLDQRLKEWEVSQ